MQPRIQIRRFLGSPTLDPQPALQPHIQIRIFLGGPASDPQFIFSIKLQPQVQIRRFLGSPAWNPQSNFNAWHDAWLPAGSARRQKWGSRSHSYWPIRDLQNMILRPTWPESATDQYTNQVDCIVSYRYCGRRLIASMPTSIYII